MSLRWHRPFPFSGNTFCRTPYENAGLFRVFQLSCMKKPHVFGQNACAPGGRLPAYTLGSFGQASAKPA